MVLSGERERKTRPIEPLWIVSARDTVRPSFGVLCRARKRVAGGSEAAQNLVDGPATWGLYRFCRYLLVWVRRSFIIFRAWSTQAPTPSYIDGLPYQIAWVETLTRPAATGTATDKISSPVLISFIDLVAAGNETRTRSRSHIPSSAKNDGLAAHSDTQTIRGQSAHYGIARRSSQIWNDDWTVSSSWQPPSFPHRCDAKR